MIHKKKKIIGLTGIIISSLLFLSIASLIRAEIEIPSIRFCPTMSYDVESKRVVLYGGLSGGDASNPQIAYKFDTWAYNPDNNSWEKFETTSSTRPWACITDAAYDSESDKIVSFGGYKAENDLNGDETWIFDYNTGKWTKATPSTKPHMRQAHRMVYDSESDVIVLFGGRCFDYLDSGEIEVFNDTWIFDTNTKIWTQQDPVIAPAGRTDFGFAYDSESDRCILFGGVSSDQRSDTWAYDVNTDSWENMDPSTHPIKKEQLGMTYDSESDKIIMHGGISSSLSSSGQETWSYDYNSNTWTKMAGSGVFRYLHDLTYDSKNDLVFTFGGITGLGEITYDKFLYSYDFNNDTWAEIPLPTDPEETPVFLYPVIFSISIISVIVLLRKRA